MTFLTGCTSHSVVPELSPSRLSLIKTEPIGSVKVVRVAVKFTDGAVSIKPDPKGNYVAVPEETYRKIRRNSFLNSKNCAMAKIINESNVGQKLL